MRKITLEFQGLAAGFTRPDHGRAERDTYLVPTPSACRNMIDQIHVKPKEFRNEPILLEILKHPDAPDNNYPIIMNYMRNEVGKKANIDGSPCIFRDADQRMSNIILYPRYRITWIIKPRTGFENKTNAFYEQTLRRIERGEQQYQPYFGCKEYVADWYSETKDKPLNINLDIGWMLYDMFDLTKVGESKKSERFNNLNRSVFHAKVINGRMDIPPFNSTEVKKEKEI